MRTRRAVREKRDKKAAHGVLSQPLIRQLGAAGRMWLVCHHAQHAWLPAASSRRRQLARVVVAEPPRPACAAAGGFIPPPSACARARAAARGRSSGTRRVPAAPVSASTARTGIGASPQPRPRFVAGSAGAARDLERCHGAGAMLCSSDIACKFGDLGVWRNSRIVRHCGFSVPRRLENGAASSVSSLHTGWTKFDPIS